MIHQANAESVRIFSSMVSQARIFDEYDFLQRMEKVSIDSRQFYPFVKVKFNIV
ncbi:MAG: hypothetical protein ACJAR6_000625 [Oleispira sp.]|jgi:hypothetical protein